MIGLDTNVLVRLLVADDPVQAEKAKRFVDAHCSPEAPKLPLQEDTGEAAPTIVAPCKSVVR